VIYSERIAIILDNKNAALEKFADLLRKENKIKNLADAPSGLCCAYYNQGNKVNEKYIIEQLSVIDRIPGKMGLEHIQIDAGYCLWGDWLDSAEHFPNGMKFIVDEIHKRGMKAGIWIAPFVAIPDSKLFKDHNDWFLKDDSGNDFEARFSSPVDFFKSLQLRVLDVTIPEVQDYITKILRQFVDWGFELIKTDFTYPLGFCTNFSSSVTRAEASRIGFETIRNAVGDDVKIMTSITQLSPVLGLADLVRVGIDTTSPFIYGIPFLSNNINNRMLRQNLRNAYSRQFLNGKIWINDADCLVFRKHSGLSKQLLDEHMQLVSTYGGAKWLGDSLDKIPWDIYEKYIFTLLGFQAKSKPAVYVVIPAYNEEKVIEKTLHSLASQKTSLPFELIFVNNKSTDGTAKIAKSFARTIKNMTIVNESRHGIGAARETGFRMVRSEIIASTDSDVVVPEEWISSIFSHFWQDKKLKGLVGTYIFESKSVVFNNLARTVMIVGDYIHKILTGSFAFRGINFAVTRDIWEKAGGFNKEVKALEDVDLSLRVGKLGKIKYIPRFTVKTTYRRFEGRFMKQLKSRSSSYFYRVVMKKSDKGNEWETVR